jgi:ABC-type multidrug transport system ATPase subunit
MAEPAALELSQIAKIYGRTPALKATTLRLEAGEVLALLGPNGSGKTTLLKIVAGALSPSLGSGTAFGLDLRSERLALRAIVGFLAGESYLYDDLTAVENLKFCATMAGLTTASPDLNGMLSDVGLVANGGERVRTFSSGMKRRLSLARMLLTSPRLLLLDEPYNSLDEDGAALVDEKVSRAASEGCAAVLATHDAERALSIATHVARLERGRLMYFGPVGAYRNRVLHVG